MLKMEDDKAGPSNPVISQSANVVVQRLDSEFPTWNLTASVGDREAGSEIEVCLKLQKSIKNGAKKGIVLV